MPCRTRQLLPREHRGTLAFGETLRRHDEDRDIADITDYKDIADHTIITDYYVRSPRLGMQRHAAALVGMISMRLDYLRGPLMSS